MADIELVIKMPKIEYEHLISKEKFQSLEKSKQEWLVNKILNRVIEGTPLKEGHGDLKDMEEIHEVLEGWNEDTAWIVDAIDNNTQTIIEADTPKRRKGTPLEENDSGYNCENWIP